MFYVGRILFDVFLDHCKKIAILAHKARLYVAVQSQQVIKHQHLAAAIFTGADADCRYFYRIGDDKLVFSKELI